MISASEARYIANSIDEELKGDILNKIEYYIRIAASEGKLYVSFDLPNNINLPTKNNIIKTISGYGYHVASFHNYIEGYDYLSICWTEGE